MNQNLTPEQLNQVIAEIQKITDERPITIEQTREILQEMNFAPELLEEALLQVQKKQAQSRQKRLGLIVSAGVLVVSALAIGGIFFWQQQRHQSLQQVTSQRGAIVLATSTDQPLQVVSPPNEVVYRVVLENAPIGETLPMGCDWVNPQGTTVHQNRYQTRQITTSIWNTQCRHTIPSDAPRGQWRVTMFLNDRPLSSATFEVE